MDTDKRSKKRQCQHSLLNVGAGILFLWLCFIILTLPVQAAEEKESEMVFYAEDGMVTVEDGDYEAVYRITQGNQVYGHVPRSKKLVLESRTPGEQENAVKSGFDVKAARDNSSVELIYRNVTLKGQVLQTHTPIQVHAVTEGTYGCIFLAEAAAAEGEDPISPVLVEGGTSLALEAKSRLIINEPEDLCAKLLWLKDGKVVITAEESIRLTGGSSEGLIYQEKGTLEFRGSKPIELTGRHTQGGYPTGIFSPRITFAEECDITIWNMEEGITQYKEDYWDNESYCYLRGSGHLLIHSTSWGVTGRVDIGSQLQFEIYAGEQALTFRNGGSGAEFYNAKMDDKDDLFAGTIYIEDAATGKKQAYEVKAKKNYEVKAIALPAGQGTRERIWIGDDAYLSNEENITVSGEYTETDFRTAYIPKGLVHKARKTPVPRYNIKDLNESVRGDMHTAPSPNNPAILENLYTLFDIKEQENLNIPIGGVIVVYQEDEKVYDRDFFFGLDRKYHKTDELQGLTLRLENVKMKGDISSSIKGFVVEIPDGTAAEIDGEFYARPYKNKQGKPDLCDTITVRGGGSLAVKSGAPSAICLEKGIAMTVDNDREDSYACSDIIIRDASLIVHSNGKFSDAESGNHLNNRIHLLDENSYLEYHAGAEIDGYCFNGDIDWRKGTVRAYLGNNSNWMNSLSKNPHIDKDVDIQCYTTADGTNPSDTPPFRHTGLDGTGGYYLFHNFSVPFEEDTLFIVTNVNNPADVCSFQVPGGSTQYIFPAETGQTYEITGGGKIVRDENGSEQFTAAATEENQPWVNVTLDESKFSLANGDVFIEKLNDEVNQVTYYDADKKQVKASVDKDRSVSISGAGTEAKDAITSKLVIEPDTRIKIVLKDWRRSQSKAPVSGPAIELKDRADVRIALAGNAMSLECKDSPAISVPESAALTLAAAGTGHWFTNGGTGAPGIGASSGNKSGTVRITGTGELYVAGGANAAAIGGGQQGEAGAITVDGKVQLTAKAGKNAPAIGGGQGKEATGSLTIGAAAELIVYEDSGMNQPVTAAIAGREQSLSAMIFDNPGEDALKDFRYCIYAPGSETPDQVIREFKVPETATSAVVSLPCTVDTYTILRSRAAGKLAEAGETKETSAATMLMAAVNPGAEGTVIGNPVPVRFSEPEIRIDGQARTIAKRKGMLEVSRGEEGIEMYLPEKAFDKEVEVWLSGEGDASGILIQDGFTKEDPLTLKVRKLAVNTGQNSAIRITGSSWVKLYFNETDEKAFRLDNAGTLPAICMDSGTGITLTNGDGKGLWVRGVLGGTLDLTNARMISSIYGSETGAYTAVDVETFLTRYNDKYPFLACGYTEAAAIRGNVGYQDGKNGIYMLNHVLNVPVAEEKQTVRWEIASSDIPGFPPGMVSEFELSKGVQSYAVCMFQMPSDRVPENPVLFRPDYSGSYMRLLSADTMKKETTLAWADMTKLPVTRMIIAENTDRFDIQNQDIKVEAFDKDQVLIKYKDVDGHERAAVRSSREEITIFQSGTEAAEHQLQIADTPVNLVLEQLNLSTKESPVSLAAKETEGTREIKIRLKGKNTLSAGKGYAAIEIPQGTTLVMTGDQNHPADTSLTAKGGENAAGIGSSANMAGGSILISGGHTEAYGGTGGAGIGGSIDGTFGKITISGGTAKAYGGAGASGIGCGTQKYCKDIVLENTGEGTSHTIVHAAGGSQGAGISTSGQQESGGISIGTGVELAAVSDGKFPAVNDMEDTIYEAYVLNHKLQTETEDELLLKVTNPENTYNSEQITIPAGYRNYALTLPNDQTYRIRSAEDEEYLIRDADGKETFTGTHQAKAVNVWLLCNLTDKEPVISNLVPAVEDELTASIPSLSGTKPLGSNTVYIWYTVDEENAETIVQEGTQAVYEVKADDCGKKIGVKIRADVSDEYYTGETKMSALTKEADEKLLTGTVIIEGIPEIRETLTAKADGFIKKDGKQAELSFKWTDPFGREVAGTDNEKQYFLPDTVGAVYKVTVTVSEEGYSGEAVSEQSPSVTKIAIGGLVRVLVEGTDEEAAADNAVPGVTLKADISGLIPEGTPKSELRYLWFSGTGDRQVSNLRLLNRGELTKDSYTLTSEEVGRTIHLMVKGDGNLYQGFLLSEGTGIQAQQAEGTVTIDGTVKVGETLTAVPDFGPEITEFAYTWTYEGGTAVLGTEQTYIVGSADVGQRICAKAVVIQQGYTGAAEAVTEEAVPDIEAESVSPVILKDGVPVTADTPIYRGDVLSWDKGTVPEEDIQGHVWMIGSGDTPNLSYADTYTVTVQDIGKEITLTVMVDPGKYEGDPSFTTAPVTTKPQTEARSGRGAKTGNTLSRVEAVRYASGTEKELKRVTVENNKALRTGTRLMGTVYIEGVRTPGETLTARTEGFTKPDGESPDMGYIWFIGDGDGVAEREEFLGIGDSYTIQESDTADKIQVMTAVKDSQYRGYAVSTNIPLAGIVRITKDTDMLATETIITADISGLNAEASGNVQYQWKRETDGGIYTDIPDARGHQYRLAPEDAGHKLRVTVTGINNLIGSTDADTDSAASAKKLSGAAKITGDAVTGGSLTAKADFEKLWNQTSPEAAYEWKDASGNILGTEAALTVPDGMEGKRLSVIARIVTPGYEGSIEVDSDVIKKAAPQGGTGGSKDTQGKGTDTSGGNIWKQNKGGYTRTGDTAPIALYSLLALAAAGAGGVIFYWRKKRSHKK